MSPWISATLLAVLVATVPLVWVLQVLRRLPEPLLASHRRWPPWANSLTIGGVTVAATVFIRSAYYARPFSAVDVGFQFLIAAVAYVFGLVLILRQFEGLYPEYFVSTGCSGLALRKVAYVNIVDVGILTENGVESTLEVEVGTGERIRLVLPASGVSRLYEAIETNKPEP
jgi:hypothetical protein